MNGQDKGLVKYKTSTLAQAAIHTLKPQVSQIIISCNRNLGDYKKFGFPIATDQFTTLQCDEYSGPIAGILSAEQLVQTQYIQLCPCDTPSIPNTLVTTLMRPLVTQENSTPPSSRTENNKRHANPVIAIPFDGLRLQPLHALINKQAIPSLRYYFNNGGRKIREWISQQASIEVDFSSQSAQFRNINRPEDLKI